MSKSVAVAVLHGIGSQGKKRDPDSTKLTFSKKLHKEVRRDYGASEFDEKIAWREIVYSDLTQCNQVDYLDRVGRKIRGGILRDFLVNNLGDAAAYRPAGGDPNHDIYKTVHDRVEEVLTDLAGDTAPDAPLVVLAHSLGGHVMSNHIYDQQKKPDYNGAASVVRCNTIASFITFGCNIPLFTFGWKYSDITAISDPGIKLPPNMRQTTWWQNYYDKDDVLGYPLAPTGQGYADLIVSKELKDKPINSGGLFTSWNAFSHNAYWSDSDLTRPVARLLRKLS